MGQELAVAARKALERLQLHWLGLGAISRPENKVHVGSWTVEGKAICEEDVGHGIRNVDLIMPRWPEFLSYLK
jgi:hypothetical protein